MMAVDILPSSIPYDASVHFSTVLMPYLRVLAQDYRGGMSKSVEDNDLRRSLEDATVAQRGHLVSLITIVIAGWSLILHSGTTT
jgi:alpha-aminoadipic semialdehyde synthase